MGYVAILLAEGFEEVEALLPCDFLRRVEIDVKLVSIGEEKLVIGSHAISVMSDLILKDVNIKDVDGVIVPGGMPGSKHLAESSDVITFINGVYAQKGFVAAICAAPTVVLTKTNFFSEKTFTCTPSQRDQLADRKYYIEAPVVVDGRVITSRGPGTTAHFTHAIITLMKDKETADEIFNRSLFTLEC